MPQKIKFTLLTLVILLVIAEVALRIVFHIQGYTVGSFAPNWFPQVEEGQVPILEQSYYTDSTGMFRADKQFWEARGVAINSQGFLGEEWDTTGKLGLLLIGDSFVWGAGADSLSQSFAARLARESGYQVFNAGIPGADPAQYQLVAERYIEELKPKVVMVCVYTGNDVVAYKREHQPNQALYYPTNLGWFPGFYQGKYFSSLEESYQFYIRQYAPKGGFAQLACYTAVGTALYSLPIRLEERREREQLLQSNVTNQHLKAISAACIQSGAHLVIVPIPYLGTDFDKPGVRDYFRRQYYQVFAGLEDNLHIFPIPKDFFHPLPDGHFNNKGHRYFAEQCKVVLESY